MVSTWLAVWIYVSLSVCPCCAEDLQQDIGVRDLELCRYSFVEATVESCLRSEKERIITFKIVHVFFGSLTLNSVITTSEPTSGNANFYASHSPEVQVGEKSILMFSKIDGQSGQLVYRDPVLPFLRIPCRQCVDGHAFDQAEKMGQTIQRIISAPMDKREEEIRKLTIDQEPFVAAWAIDTLAQHSANNLGYLCSLLEKDNSTVSSIELDRALSSLNRDKWVHAKSRESFLIKACQSINNEADINVMDDYLRGLASAERSFDDGGHYEYLLLCIKALLASKACSVKNQQHTIESLGLIPKSVIDRDDTCFADLCKFVANGSNQELQLVAANCIVKSFTNNAVRQMEIQKLCEQLRDDKVKGILLPFLGSTSIPSPPAPEGAH